MDFSLMTSVGSYVRTMKLQTTWQRKKETGDYSTLDEKTAEKQRVIEQFREQESKRDKEMEKIQAKLDLGTKLTPEEMQYLQKKNPVVYQKVKALEAEKAAYEKALRRCKTKEDVQRLKNTMLNSTLSTLRAVENNPNIPKQKKLEIFQAEQRRLNALGKIEQKFVENGELAELPTEAEVRKAEADRQEAERAERKAPADRAESETETETAEKADGDRAPEKSAPALPGDKASPKPRKAKIPDAEMPGEKELSRAEAEQTPEARKVRRARQKLYKRRLSDEDMPAPFFTGRA